MKQQGPKLKRSGPSWLESVPQTTCKPKAGRRNHHKSVLRFSPYAWAKLLFVRDFGSTEVGGFGITRADDLLFVEDIRLVKQRCTSVTVQFDDAAVADFFDGQIDQGLRPEQFARVWVHSHPADSAEPSAVDEETFSRVFGGCDWAVMAIVACGGQAYARLRFNVGPGSSVLIPIEVEFGKPFSAADPDAWAAEYEQHVAIEELQPRWTEEPSMLGDPFDLAESLDALELTDPEETFL